MTTIKARCPGCGEVDLTADDIVLRISTTSSYGFSCPTCGDFVQKPADDRVVRLLLSGGVIPSMLQVPAEALETHEGPPIGPDDILEMHELLQTSGWFERLLRVERGRP